MTEETQTEILECELSEEELLERGDEQSKKLLEIAQLEMEKSLLTAKIKPLKERVGELAVIINEKKEKRPVPVEWIPNYERRTKSLVRMDTGEVINKGKLSEAEMQMGLSMGGGL